MAGPYAVTAGASANEVILDAPIIDDYSVSEGEEEPFYVFGTADNIYKQCKVSNIRPSGEGVVQITAVVYRPETYSFDTSDPPALNNSSVPPIIPGLPTVTGLTVTPYPDSVTQVIATWNPSVGADHYVIEISHDGVVWEPQGTVTTTSYFITVSEGHLWVRVAAINVGRGPWINWDGDVGEADNIPGDIETIALSSAWTGDSVSIEWNVPALASGYRVDVYDVADPIGAPNGILSNSYNTTNPTFTYDLETAEAQGATVRDLRFVVVATNSLGDSETAIEISANNPKPLAPTGLSSTLITTDSTDEPGS
jgi:hypothetical protein